MSMYLKQASGCGPIFFFPIPFASQSQSKCTISIYIVIGIGIHVCIYLGPVWDSTYLGVQ